MAQGLRSPWWRPGFLIIEKHWQDKAVHGSAAAQSALKWNYMSLSPGIYISHYLIKDLICQGGMGDVWRADDLGSDQPVAIKAVAHDLFLDPDFRIRIQDEARRHLRLYHRNIVPVIDVFESPGETCIVMKLIEGTSLKNLLENVTAGRLQETQAIQIMEDILKALDYGHQRGIVHRDVKPSNVLLDKDHRALLIDFGIALSSGEERRTRTGQIVGTPPYMSPEQITKPTHIDHRSDVYSAGCVLYEMLTGRPPFVKGEDGIGDTDYSIQEAHVKNRPQNPRKHIETISADLDRLVMKALEKNPEKRIPGCREFIRLLEGLGLDPVHEPDSDPDMPSWHAYHFILISALLMAVLLLLFLIMRQ